MTYSYNINNDDNYPHDYSFGIRYWQNHERDPACSPITIRHFLSHSSGLGSSWNAGEKDQKIIYKQRFLVSFGSRIKTFKTEDSAYFYADSKTVFWLKNPVKNMYWTKHLISCRKLLILLCSLRPTGDF